MFPYEKRFCIHANHGRLSERLWTKRWYFYARYTDTDPSIIGWNVIRNNPRLSQVFVDGTLNSDLFVHNVRPFLLLFCYTNAIFYCNGIMPIHATPLLWPARSVHRLYWPWSEDVWNVEFLFMRLSGERDVE